MGTLCDLVIIRCRSRPLTSFYTTQVLSSQSQYEQKDESTRFDYLGTMNGMKARIISMRASVGHDGEQNVVAM